MKQWLIKASASFCGTDTVYLAYCDEDPLDREGIWDYIIDDLWNKYSWELHLEDEEFDSEDKYEEAMDQAWEDWQQDCEVYAEEADDEEVSMHAPAGDIANIEIVLDERNEE